MAIEITIIKHDINDDIKDKIEYVQYDNNSRILQFEVTDRTTAEGKDNGGCINLNNCDVYLIARKESGEVVMIDGEILDPYNGQFRFVLSQQILAEVGDVQCQYLITSPDTRLSSREFKIKVKSSLAEDVKITSSTELTALTEALQDATAASAVLSVLQEGYVEYVAAGGTLEIAEWVAQLSLDVDNDTNDENKQITSVLPPIPPAVVRDLFRCAMTYVNHKDELIFTSSGSGTMIDDDFSIDNPLIDCSSMIQAWIEGIPYEYSKYNGLEKNIKHFRYGMPLPPNPYDENRPNRYYANELARYLYDQGYTFAPNADYSNISAGDIIFVSFANRVGQDFHDNAFMNIDHCLLVVGFKDDAHLTCLHTSESSVLRFYDVCVREVSYDSTSNNSYNDAIVLVGRIPYHHTNSISGEPILSDTEEFTTTSTSSGKIKDIALTSPLKTNTPYTAVIHLENAFDQSVSAATNYLGLRASYESGNADETIASWQYNKYPDDNVYYLRFVTGDDPIAKLMVYVLNNTVAGHNFKYLYLYEGFVNPTI